LEYVPDQHELLQSHGTRLRCIPRGWPRPRLRRIHTAPINSTLTAVSAAHDNNSLDALPAKG
jgi:hypothetical protein